MTSRAVHQFHAGCAFGDGITNGMFFIQRMLREADHVSEIYCIHIDPRLDGRVLPFTSHADAPGDILLVHYSLGSDLDDWVTSRASPLVLIYHNITPAEFFPPGSDLARLADLGRRQLAIWAAASRFQAVIADSAFNADELTALGFRNVAPIGLLVDLARLRRHAWDAELAGAMAGARNLVFIGRVCAHKNQLALVRMMPTVIAASGVPVRLLLAGDAGTGEYRAEIEAEIARLALGPHVRLLGQQSDAAIYALYRLADVFVSASRHEGFGMPLVEAMEFDLPVVAVAAGSVAATLGDGGLVVADETALAPAILQILRQPGVRRRVIQGGRRAVARFERAVLEKALASCLREAGLDTALSAPTEAPVPPGLWRVEGPYDSSYSLAIVNRELARGLARANEPVALSARDGPGPQIPDGAFLRANPDVRAMAMRDQDAALPRVVLRNQFPPTVWDMRGVMRVLANYAWEESGFPAPWVEEFNASLDLVTVTSRFVAKVLRDNGVSTPIAVVGNGVDQVTTAPPAQPQTVQAGFGFLHVSSGFPRKGTDVLLAAWGAAFTANDAAELVIKTFPNIHNRIAEELAAFRATHPTAAPIRLIDADVDDAAMAALYATADAVVCPSRGEGFGLPLAEAMALGKPVITTGFGGQTDFCTDATAWLCDYQFAPARTHLGVLDSVWVEPDAPSLAQAMRAVFKAPPDHRAHRAAAGQAQIRAHHGWNHVTARTRAAVATVWASAEAETLPRIGVVSTWNTKCGIADYARQLMGEIPDLAVFANHEPDTLGADEPFVLRCWTQGWADPLDATFNAICESGVPAVVIQFNFGFFDLASLGRLLDRLHRHGVLTFVVLHATQDVLRPDLTIRLGDIRAALAGACRLLVHSVHDLNRLKAAGLTENVALFPMGLPAAPVGDRAEVRARLGWGAVPVVASFGYLLPGKGLRELIAAVAILRARIPHIRLAMLNALYPVAASAHECWLCWGDIQALGLGDCVTLESDFLDEAEILARLGAADVVAYPYQSTQESASAAVKMGLSALTPIAVTPIPIFDDIAAVAHVLPGLDAASIAAGLEPLLLDGAAAHRRQQEWVAAHAWPLLSRRLGGLILGCLRDRDLGFSAARKSVTQSDGGG